MTVDSLYICPWGIKDPLCVSQSLSYVRGLVAEGFTFALITFESGRFPITAVERKELRKKLQSEKILWYPVNWNQGTGLFSKFLSIGAGLMSGVRICLRHRPKLIHSRSSLPAFIAVALAKLFQAPLLYDADSVLSEEYADIGYVRRNSYGLRFLAWSERWARRSADQMIVLTEALKADLKEKGLKVSIEVIPCCIDTERFCSDADARQQKRHELGLGDELLAVYVGKSGSWYLVEETFALFRNLRELDPASKLLVLSPDPAELFDKIAAETGVEQSSYFHRHAAPEEVPGWLSACDLGFSLIRQLPSKRGSSPVKFAEYLSCELPVVVTSGIGDCSEITHANNVGMVITQLSETNLERSATQLNDLLREDTESLKLRCRETARREFDLINVGISRYRDIYSRILPKPRATFK